MPLLIWNSILVQECNTRFITILAKRFKRFSSSLVELRNSRSMMETNSIRTFLTFEGTISLEYFSALMTDNLASVISFRKENFAMLWIKAKHSQIIRLCFLLYALKAYTVSTICHNIMIRDILDHTSILAVRI